MDDLDTRIGLNWNIVAREAFFLGCEGSPNLRASMLSLQLRGRSTEAMNSFVDTFRIWQIILTAI